VHQAGTGQYDALIQTYADKHGLAPALVKAVIQTESGGNPRAVSPAGAMGLMQLMPSNVQEAGIADPYDPEQNIAAGTQQLSDLMKQYGGDLDLTLAGYNAGPGNVRKYGGVPPFRETQSYIRKVRAAMEHGGA
jgi:soluble lytic murein transglycosylase